MIFDLSKDKNLHNLLGKVDLDEETSNLVKSRSSASSIRKSLESNITSSNLIQYRKYILKATEEEKEEAAAERARVKAEQLEGRQMVGDAGTAEDEVDLATQQHKEGQIKNESAEQLKKKEYKVALRALQTIVKTMPILKDIKSDINSNNRLMSNTYDNMTQKQSNFIIAWLTYLTKDNNALVLKYESFLSEENGKKTLVGKKWNDKGAEEDAPKLDIIVEDLQTELNRLLSATFTIKGRKMGFYEVMIKLHHATYGSEPKTTINVKQRKKNLSSFLDSIRNKTKTKKDPFVLINDRMQTLDTSLESVIGKKVSLENEIARLKKFGSSGLDIIVADKFQQLSRGLNSVLNDSKRLNLEQDFVKDKLKEMRELQKNPKKYEKELKKEIEDNIEIEIAKLNKIIEDLARFDKFEKSLERFKSIIQQHSEDSPTKEVEDLMITVSIKLVEMNKRVNELNDIVDDKEQIISDWRMEQLKSGKTVNRDGTYSGMSLVDTETVAEIDGLTEEYSELNKLVSHLIDKIDNLL